jgi:hypothetical protein
VTYPIAQRIPTWLIETLAWLTAAGIVVLLFLIAEAL